ncbi:putative leader peptide [Streptomyces sp. NPDC001714]
MTQDEMYAKQAEEVRDMTRVASPSRRTVLHSRPHIDLLRVAGALCCS